MSKISIVYSTFSKEEDAEVAVMQLIAEGLIGCANIMPPHKAIYKWKGDVQQENEVVCIFKTTEELASKMISRLHGLHPYDVPCILQWDVKALPDYVKGFI